MGWLCLGPLYSAVLAAKKHLDRGSFLNIACDHTLRKAIAINVFKLQVQETSTHEQAKLFDSICTIVELDDLVRV